VPLYETYAQILLGMNDLPTFVQRRGGSYRGEGEAMAQFGTAAARGVTSGVFSPVWGRFEGKHVNLNHSTAALSTSDADYWKFEGGIDAATLDNGYGRLIFGVTGHYSEAKSEVSSFFGNGRINVSGGGVGGTATWLGDDGLYVDSQARVSWYNGDLTSALTGPMTRGNDGFGYALSTEGGKRFAIGEGWSLTPQLQATYSNVDFDTFLDRFGAVVSLSQADSLLGRAGLSLDHRNSWRDGSGQMTRSDIYGIANVYYEFLDGSSVDVSGTRFANAGDRLWGGVGAGGSFSWNNDRYALFGEVSYKTSLDDLGDSYSYKGTAGLRLRW
jgi:fibronectin-binding autotransporter adhesin